MNESVIALLDTHRLNVLRRIRQVVGEVSPDLLLAFDGLGLIEELETRIDHVSTDGMVTVTLGETIKAAGELYSSKKEDISIEAEVEEKEEAQSLSVSDVLIPSSKMDPPCVICGSDIYDIDSEEFLWRSVCCSKECADRWNKRVEAAKIIDNSLSIGFREEEAPDPPKSIEKEKLHTCLSCGQLMCKGDEKVCQGCVLQVTERSIPIPRASGLNGKSIDELIQAAPRLNTCYEPAKLVQLARSMASDPEGTTGLVAQKFLNIEKVSQTAQPMIWARYHGSNLRDLLPFERNEYVQALLVHRQRHNQERGETFS